MKKIIGITGGIGSGKTTVANFISVLGFPVYNSDYWAKELVNIDPNLKTKIISLLGNEAYDFQDQYNRKWVSEKVFNHAELLQQLNHIIHPAVALHFTQWVEQQNSNMVFKETALLFELKLHLQCFKTILVTAEDNIRIKRVMDRDNKTYREVEAILQKQMPEKEKIKKADFIIENNSNLTNLEKSTHKVMEELKQLQ